MADGPYTATAPAQRGGGGQRYTATPVPSSAGADMAAGATYLPQQDYLNGKANPDELKRFIKDWINLGNRGIIGGDGKPTSYWDVYQDLIASGIDVADLPKPEELPQGNVKGGGSTVALTAAAQAGPAPAPAAAPAQGSQEMTDLLKTIGLDYANAPAATPALLAFLRGLQGTLATTQQTRDTALAQIGQRATDATTETNRLGARNKQNVTADLIRRGVLSSGEATGRFARGAEDLAAKLSDITRTRTEATSQAETGMASASDAIRQAALERVLSTEQEQSGTRAQSEAQAEAFRQQQQAADVAYQRQLEATRRYQDWAEEMARQGQGTP